VSTLCGLWDSIGVKVSEVVGILFDRFSMRDPKGLEGRKVFGVVEVEDDVQKRVRVLIFGIVSGATIMIPLE